MAMRRVPSWRSLRGAAPYRPPAVPVNLPGSGEKNSPSQVWRQHRKRMPLVYVDFTWEEVVVAGNSEYERRLAAYEQEVSGLLEQVKTLEEEVVQLRRKLQDAPKRVRTLEERLLETKGQLAQAVSQNEKLSYTLREAREQIADLREEVEKLTQPEVEELVLEEVPDISYEDIGGLDNQIEQITDAVELPWLHRDLFVEHQLPAPKGVLLYGPPGCGKTLIAKAVANSLAKKVSEVTGDKNARSY